MDDITAGWVTLPYGYSVLENRNKSSCVTGKHDLKLCFQEAGAAETDTLAVLDVFSPPLHAGLIHAHGLMAESSLCKIKNQLLEPSV